MPPTVITAALTGTWPDGKLATGTHYATAMAKMLARYAPGIPFVLFSDRSIPGVMTIPITDKRCRGVLSKMFVYKPGHFDPGTRILQIDMDTAIVAPLTQTLSVPLELPVAASLRGWPVGGAISFEVGAWSRSVWELFAAQPQLVGRPARVGEQVSYNDEQFFARAAGAAGWASWQSLAPGAVIGFKADLKFGRLDPGPPAEIVMFDGNPRPHTVRLPWNGLYM